MMSPPSLSGKGAGGLGGFESDLVSGSHLFIALLICRQSDGKNRAFTRFAFHRNISAHHLTEFSAYHKPQEVCAAVFLLFRIFILE